MKKLLLAVVLCVMVVPQVRAASQDECAIWICLPGGFPSGCSGAYSAMVSRLKDFKPPLPNFLSCAVKSEGNSDMSYDYNYAAYIPAGRVCSQWVDTASHGDATGYSECVQWSNRPERYVKGTKCRTQKEDENTPAGCTGTARYVDVYIDGQVAGQTYFWETRRPSRW